MDSLANWFMGALFELLPHESWQIESPHDLNRQLYKKRMFRSLFLWHVPINMALPVVLTCFSINIWAKHESVMCKSTPSRICFFLISYSDDITSTQNPYHPGLSPENLTISISILRFIAWTWTLKYMRNSPLCIPLHNTSKCWHEDTIGSFEIDMEH